ncbi:MAG: amidohydrolase, partial [Rhodospirillales bacterium]|nr:amidohydrolase [Rhodospirillales bacterium]
TSALVAEKLRSWGIEVTTGVGKLGVVGTLRGSRPGQHTIGLRADMDALAIHEMTGKPYASKNEGTMHACGHDGHTTMLLGAAKHLAAHRDFSGTVNFIFQPAEEGRGGAQAMLADRLFERFPCDSVWGMHCWPNLPVGQYALRKGATLAGGGGWRVVFRGNGGHGGAGAHLAADLSVALAQFVLGLQTIVSRNVASYDTAVISVGAIHGGSMDSINVMPAEIEVGGTARFFSVAVRDLIERRMGELAELTAKMVGATAEMTTNWGFTPLINHDAETDIATAVAASVGGAAAVKPMQPSTGGEDFAFMLEQRPGAFIMLGNGPGSGVHTPTFDFNDEAIPYGVGYWVSLVRQELGAA